MEAKSINHQHALANQLSLPIVVPVKKPAMSRLKSLSDFQRRPLSLLERLSSLSPTRHNVSNAFIRQQFFDLLTEPISEQHQRHFQKYFHGDIRDKTFTIDEFGRFFQITSILSQRILKLLGLNNACERNCLKGEDVIRIARLLWISPMSVKAFILFKLFDENDNDKITKDEIRAFYESYLSEFRFFKDRTRLQQVVDIFLQGFFRINDQLEEMKELNFEQFYRILQQNPSVFKSLYLISIPDQDKEEEQERNFIQRWCLYLQNNVNRIIFFILYILLVMGLISYVIVYRTMIVKAPSVWQIIARVGGMLVNLNFVLAICLMLKQTMTIIRRCYYLRLFIPVDDHIDAHRFIGTMLFISGIVHTFGHVIHFATHTKENSWAASMFTTAAQVGWVGYCAPITGDILVLLLLIMVICSFQCIRQRAGCFQLFRYTHYLFWPIFILLILHAKDFWKWAIGPMSLFCLEKFFLCKRHLPNYGRTRLISVKIEDEQAFTLNIERPRNFHFHIGEYINISFPHIVRNEWHPFTICSSPERKDILRLTIMKKKNWTKKIYDYFSSQLQELSEIITENSLDNQSTNNLIKSKEIHFSDSHQKDAIICIEGPFSTCTSYIFDCEHVVLIGAGVGITPYISALENLIDHFREERCTCQHCGQRNYHPVKLPNAKLKKIDFIWVNRDISNITWFRNILEEFQVEQDAYLNTSDQHHRSRYLDIHLYCTSIRSNEQAMLGNLHYDLVANMYEVMQHQDMHTQLRTPTHFGRPPWKLLFAKFKAEHRTSHVFFTGNQAMGKEIQKQCDEYQFTFQHEPYF